MSDGQIKLEEDKAEILTQGSRYHGSDYNGNDKDDSIPDESKSSKPKLNFDIKSKPMLILGLSIGGVVLIILLIVLASSGSKAPFEDVFKGDPTPTVTVEHTPTPTVKPEPTPFTYYYSNDEIYSLREHGYTGWEIDSYAEECVPAEELIEQAKRDRQAIYDAEIKVLFDSASPEYLELMNSTWLGLEKFEVSGDTGGYSYYSNTFNVDYEKIEAHGMQLFIKLYLEEFDNYVFMQMEPDRYVKLKDSGNIVVQVDYIEMSNGNKVVIKVKEKAL